MNAAREMQKRSAKARWGKLSQAERKAAMLSINARRPRRLDPFTGRMRYVKKVSPAPPSV